MRTAVIALLAGAVSAAPAPTKRAYSNMDVNVLNYALTLEHLEDKFYREALANYTSADFAAVGFPEPFYENLKAVSADETTHVNFITSALKSAGAPAVAECTYSFPAMDAKTFLMLASVIEGVGVSAYLGAAMDILNPSYLQAAAQIVTIEARHTAYFRKELGEAGMPQPFSTPLDMDQVYTLASPFIVACPPTNPKLPVKAFPAIALGTMGEIYDGQSVSLMTSAKGATHAAFMALTGPVFMPATPISGGYSTKIPANFGGQTYAILTSSDSSVTDENTIAGPAIIEVANVF